MYKDWKIYVTLFTTSFILINVISKCIVHCVNDFNDIKMTKMISIFSLIERILRRSFSLYKSNDAHQLLFFLLVKKGRIFWNNFKIQEYFLYDRK